MPVCKFCKTELNTKSALNTHQRSSKYCIKLREDNKNAKEIEHVSYDCEFCKKELSSKYRLNSHLTICKIKRKQDEGENNKIKEKNISDKIVIKKSKKRKLNQIENEQNNNKSDDNSVMISIPSVRFDIDSNKMIVEYIDHDNRLLNSNNEKINLDVYNYDEEIKLFELKDLLEIPLE